METNLYLDIETIPAQRPDILAEIRETKSAELKQAIAAIKPPGNYKKAETIDQWMTEEAPKIAQGLRDAFEADVDAEYRRTGLDGSFGQVCVIGWAIDGDKPESLFGMNEADILSGFSIALNHEKLNPFNTTVIGHNVAAFDLRFLMQRHIVNGLRPHPVIVRACQAKPWEADKVFDTMVQWGGLKPGGSLDKLCKALNVPTPKGEITGATVWDFVKTGRIEDVAAYCRRDVEATRQVHRLMTFQQAA